MSEVDTIRELVAAKGYTHLVLDLDATIAHIHLPWAEGYRSLDARLSGNGGTSFHTAIVQENRVFGHVFNEYVRTYPHALPTIIEWARDFEAVHAGYAPHNDLITTLADMAADGIWLGLWTSNVRATARYVLSDIGLLSLFSAIATREDVTYIKPDIEGWQHLYDGTPLKEWLFIGDSSNDRHAAEAVGIDYFNITHFK